MKTFIEPPSDRYQQAFFRETIDDSIPSDHPVRAVDFIVEQFDYSGWLTEYSGGGRPSYPPCEMCKLIIYGNMVGINSSRKLEYVCLNNKDFIWLLNGYAPDHDTIADFRKRYAHRFKEIFKQTVVIGINTGIVSMRRIAVDGTRVKSNSSRWKTKKASDIEKMLSELDSRIDGILKSAADQDQRENDLFGNCITPNKLPKELADLKKRQELLKKAFKKVKEKSERAVKTGSASKEKAAEKRVPITDPDSDVMKNKDGGFAPNYNAHLAVDCESGMIVAQGVTNEHVDAGHLQPACEEAIEATGITAEQVLADSAYSTTENLEYLEERGIDACIPPMHSNPHKDREKKQRWADDVPRTLKHRDGSDVDGAAMPRDSEGKFDKSAFKYDEQNDCYICPLGHSVKRFGKTTDKRQHPPKIRYRYRCGDCGDCSFRPVCTTDPRGRTISRNEDAFIHERHKARMHAPHRKDKYKLRRQTVEPTFGIMKDIHNMRRFLTRGMKGVRIEWSIASVAFNVKKLVKHINGNVITLDSLAKALV
ncbi:IS1182 family transposase [Candidatus Babeliales bacterium]|nr:IS1182 family transposase [Candidatus Babeliales bacterium]